MLPVTMEMSSKREEKFERNSREEEYERESKLLVNSIMRTQAIFIPIIGLCQQSGIFQTVFIDTNDYCLNKHNQLLNVKTFDK